MKIILRWTAFTGVIAALASGCAWSRPIQTLRAKFNGMPCIIELDPRVNDTVHLYKLTPSGRREVWRGISKSLRPWKITIGDVDGDGKEELGVGVYKKARFHPVMAKRPFVYGWDGERMYPKWLGSRLSRPFSDFVFARFSGGTKLVAIEQARDGRHELAVYKWEGFGFTREWAGAHSRRLSGLAVCGSPGKQVILVKRDGSNRSYSWDGRTLAIKEARP